MLFVLIKLLNKTNKHNTDFILSLVSPETRALMEQVLASGAGAEEVSGRVAMLLAGSSLTTSKGVAKGPGREVEAVSYDTGKECRTGRWREITRLTPAAGRLGRTGQAPRRTHDLSQALRFSRRRHSWMTGRQWIDAA